MSGDRLDLLARIQELERENKELKEYTNTQPYKFEDLKEQMFVYEINLDNVFQIEYTTENIETKEKFVYGFGCGVSRLTKIKFEENSFFPVKRENAKERTNIVRLMGKH